MIYYISTNKYSLYYSWLEKLLDPNSYYKSQISQSPEFIESNEFQGYSDRVQPVCYSNIKKQSTISVKLPVHVMKDGEMWSHRKNYILAYEIQGKKFYACTLHAQMTSFQKDYNMKRAAASIEFQE